MNLCFTCRTPSMEGKAWIAAVPVDEEAPVCLVEVYTCSKDNCKIGATEACQRAAALLLGVERSAVQTVEGLAS